MTVTKASKGLAYALELTGSALEQSQDAIAELQSRVVATFEQIEKSLSAEAAAYEVSSPDGPEAGVMLRALDLVRAAMGQPPQHVPSPVPPTEPVEAEGAAMASANGTG